MADRWPAEAEVLVDAQAVEKALDQMAVRIDLALRDRNPIVMGVLQGGLYVTGALLRRLHFPLQQDTVHVGRYAGTQGGALTFFAEPNISVEGRVVLLTDDVFDHGVTLATVAQHVSNMGADAVMSAVLVRKAVARDVDFQPDFVALECPDRYLFGCGMDYEGYWRNLPAIYALGAAS